MDFLINASIKLQLLGLKWGMGDSRNPDEIKSGKPCLHTNSVVLWYFWKGKWRRFYRSGTAALVREFSCCETEEDIDIIVELLDELEKE